MNNLTIETDTGFYLKGQSALYDLSSSDEKVESERRLETLYEDLQTALKPDICIEVGAGSGDNALHLHEKLPDTQILAFEGNPLITATTHKTSLAADKDPTLQYMKRIIAGGNSNAPFVCRQNIDGTYSLDEATDFDPTNISRTKLASDKNLRTYSLNVWKGKLTGKNVSLRINTHKMLYSIMKGMEMQLFEAQTLFLNIPSIPRRPGDWTSENIIIFMSEGGFKPLARDFPENEKCFRMIFIKDKLAPLPEVQDELKKFLTRFPEDEGSD